MTLADVGLYFYDVTAGFLLTVFIVVYFVLELGLYYNTRPRLANEIINFATQYATVQKKLLNEFEIPYALLDYTGKILWVNERFSELTGVGRNYHKSITTLFSNITREFLQKHEDAQDITIEKKERIFRISLNRIYFDDIMEESKEIDVKGSDEFQRIGIVDGGSERMRNRTMLKQMELSTEKESLFRCCRRNALSLWRKVG